MADRAAAFFLNAGYDLTCGRGRSVAGLMGALSEIFKSEPSFRTKKKAWSFRIGPSYEWRQAGRVGPAVPRRAVRQFAAGIPVGDQRRGNAEAYDALVQKICPCIIHGAQQGGNFGFTGRAHAPDKVKALIRDRALGRAGSARRMPPS